MVSDIDPEPTNKLFHIYIVNRATSEVIYDDYIVALSESDAIKSNLLSNQLSPGNLKREDIDFYIGIAAYLYEGKTFKAELEELVGKRYV